MPGLNIMYDLLQTTKLSSNTTENTWCGSCTGDSLSIKLYGPPHHASGDCCWCITYVDEAGKFLLGGEGPHPHGNCDKPGDKVVVVGGSIGSSKNICVKVVMEPGPKMTAYGLVGGQWKQMGTRTGPCGCDQTSPKRTGSQVTFRCDGSFSTTCATVKPLGGGGAPGAPAPAAPTKRVIAGAVEAKARARCRARHEDIGRSILNRV